MQISYLVFAMAVLIAQIFARPSVFKVCKLPSATIKSVDISPCDSNPCILKRGTKPSISLTYVAKDEIKSGKAVIHAKVQRISVPFSLPDNDLCKFSKNTSCPIAAGTQSTYTNSLEIKQLYPSINIVVRWELQDETGKDIICVNIPVSIK